MSSHCTTQRHIACLMLRLSFSLLQMPDAAQPGLQPEDDVDAAASESPAGEPAEIEVSYALLLVWRRTLVWCSVDGAQCFELAVAA